MSAAMQNLSGLLALISIFFNGKAISVVYFYLYIFLANVK